MTPPLHRYASREMVLIWDEANRVSLMRQLWIQIMKAQADAGIDHPQQEIRRYEVAAPRVDLGAIRYREALVGHETQANLLEFNTLAGSDRAHWGLTSCDITETVTAWQVAQSLRLITARVRAVLHQLVPLAQQYRDTAVVGRTHGLPAQLTTIGHRYARCVSELGDTMRYLHGLSEVMPARGVRGAVGTNSDLTWLERNGDCTDLDLTDTIDNAVAELTGLREFWAVGQTPPRSTDAAIAGLLVSLCSGPVTLATTFRLMVQLELGDEIPTRNQVGSSAMPHKANPRYAERVCGLQHVVRGYASMIQATSGGTWNEGDVSDSSVRRIALPGLFESVDGLLRTFQVAVSRFHPNEEAIAREVRRYRVETATGRLLARYGGLHRTEVHNHIRELAQQMRGWPVDVAIERFCVELAKRLGIDDPGQVEQVIQTADTGLAGVYTDYALSSLGWTAEPEPTSCATPEAML